MVFMNRKLTSYDFRDIRWRGPYIPEELGLDFLPSAASPSTPAIFAIHPVPSSLGATVVADIATASDAAAVSDTTATSDSTAFGVATAAAATSDAVTASASDATPVLDAATGWTLLPSRNAQEPDVRIRISILRCEPCRNPSRLVMDCSGRAPLVAAMLPPTLSAFGRCRHLHLLSGRYSSALDAVYG